MTENQLRYLQYQEGKRHNLATEEDTDIANTEKERANRADEAEATRSNQAREAETYRSNRAKEQDADIDLAFKGVRTVTGAIKDIADPVVSALKFL